MSDNQSISGRPGKRKKRGKKERGEKRDGRRKTASTAMKFSLGQMKETEERIDTVIEDSMAHRIEREEEEEEGDKDEDEG